MAFSVATNCHLMPRYGEKQRSRCGKHRNIEEKNIFSKKNIKKVEKRLALANIFCIFAHSRKSSCRFHLEAYDSCETTFYT